MSGALYTMDVLRMAAQAADFPLLADAPMRDERRSPTCGSRVTVTLALGEDGRIADIGIEAKACALGQAASVILASHARGRSAREIADASEAWRAYLARESNNLPDWPGLELLSAGRDYPARHPSMRLAFEAASSALARADVHG